MSKWAAAALLAAFAALCFCRLNGFSLVDPDSAEHLFGAKSLASFHGYRELDRPGQPPQTVNPPGLSLLLVPLAWVAPYSAVGAKLIVLGISLAAVFLTVSLASGEGPAAWPIVAGAIFVTSPLTLLQATEVLPEFPYLACSLAAMLLMMRSADPPTRREIRLATVLLGFLPFLATTGLALVAAVLIWCLATSSRRAFWPAPVAALGASALWLWRNWIMGGALPFKMPALDELRLLAEHAIGVLLPGVPPGAPLYAQLTIGGSSGLDGLYGAGLAVAVLIVGLAIYGLWRRRARDGVLIALYVVGFTAMLALDPRRDPRGFWPLVPILVVMAIDGIKPFGRPARLTALAVAFALILWQSMASLAIARDNLAWEGGGDRFYAERIPPLYFADWRTAGAWLRGNARPGSTVLTRHADTGLTSGLLQERVRFEEMSAPEWRSRIADLHARYLVVPTTLYGKLFPLDLLASDTVYTYAVRWEGKDVAVIEVAPNRSGKMSPATGAQEAAASCDRALAREPARSDLAARCGELRAAPAPVLDPEDPASLELRGEREMRRGDYQDAIASYRAAAERGNARAGARADALSDALAVEGALTTADADALMRAASFWSGEGAPGKALDLLEQAAPRFPDQAEIASRLGELRRFYGF